MGTGQIVQGCSYKAIDITTNYYSARLPMHVGFLDTSTHHQQLRNYTDTLAVDDI